MCGFGSLHHSSDDAVRIKPASCRSWACETCAPIRKMLCEIEARSGNPNRFLTLTCNPAVGSSPGHRRKIMGKAFPKLMKRIGRLHGGVAPQYFVVVERTKAGEPHFHVLLRCSYVDHKLLSRWWRELTGAWVVDIRAVHGERQAARYVAKYLAKAPVRFGSSKRYWSSRGWLLNRGDEPALEWRREAWRWCRDEPDAICRLYQREGWQLVPHAAKNGMQTLVRAPWWKAGEAPVPSQFRVMTGCGGTGPPAPMRKAA